jgi:putative alpha-1,2-mannosidase
VLLSACTTDGRSPADFVDPFIGTGAQGHTFPGAALPFGLVQLSPDTGYRGVKAYNHAQTSILGFSHTHLSGTGPGTKTHYNNILVVPTVGELQVRPGIVRELDALSREALARRLAEMPVEEAWHTLPPPEREAKEKSLLQEERRRALTGLARRGFNRAPALKGYESRFDHATEEASPGYYAVTLEDYGVRAELTATERVGFHRYTFPETREAHILVDATHSLTPGRETEVRVVDRRRIEGYTVGDREGFHEFPLTCYFVAEFSRDFDSFGTWKGGEVHHGTREMSGDDGVGAFVNFSTSEGEEVLVKVGLSFVSLDGARRNLDAELPHWDFDRVRRQARETWDGKLRRMRVKGGTDEQKTIL